MPETARDIRKRTWSGALKYRDDERTHRKLQRLEGLSSRDSRTVFFSGVEYTAPGKAVSLFLFRHHNVRAKKVTLMIDHITGQSKGMGTIELYSIKDVVKTLKVSGSIFKHLHSKEEKPIWISAFQDFYEEEEVAERKSEQQQWLRVQNLPEDIEGTEIRMMFQTFGPIDRIKLKVCSSDEDEDEDESAVPLPVAYIGYSRQGSSTMAHQQLEGKTIFGKALALSIVEGAPSSKLDGVHEIDAHAPKTMEHDV